MSVTKRDKASLLAEVLNPPAVPAAQGKQNLVQILAGQPTLREWLEYLSSRIPEATEPRLADLMRFALLGICVGFMDRHLSPYVPEHQAVITPLLDDIGSVYRDIQYSKAEFSMEEFVFRAYDYGIHKAYYLDWDLYLSKDMY